jgi:bacterioferritin (cytochrome b1)
LNTLLADELTAVSQYMVYSEMYNNWGCARLHKAVANYNAVIQQAGELGDHVTRDMLTSTLKDEEGYIDWLEAQKDQINQMGIQFYLSLQVKE